MRRALLTAAIAALVVLAGCAGTGGDAASQQLAGGDGGSGGASGQVGVSAGGAQDANAFRTNVEEGYVPQPTDLTYEGLFHDYYFDTGQSEPCERDFCPSYSAAVRPDPLSNETEQFLTVGLNSGLTESDIRDEPVNLVVVVDTSGSMDSPFDQYYYDGGERVEVEENAPKMDAASDAVVSMLDQLDGEDRVSVVSYDDQARVLQDLQRVDETDMGALRSDVQGLRADGGTNLDAGMSTANEQVAGVDTPERETRVVYVTDAMPNIGQTDDSALRGRLQSQADAGVHSTFVGVGVDFNSRLTESIATIRGANYYTVDSPRQFEERMTDGFEYMTSPLAYNLSLQVESEGYEIEQVYGSPQADAAGTELISVTTLFPSRREGNKSEGGVVLVELAETDAEDRTLNLTATYETTDGVERESTRTVAFEEEGPYYESSGVRKATLLAEYGNLLRNWMAYERAAASDDGEAVTPVEGIEPREFDGQWEQSSVPLRVSDAYADRIVRFASYFDEQAAAFDSDRFERDRTVLATIVEHAKGKATVAPATGDRATGADGRTTIPTTTGPSMTTVGASDDAAANGRAAVAAAPFSADLSAIGLVNLLVTLAVAAYGVTQKRRARDGDGGRR
jgi:Ca-activated chloride channel family protein